MTVRLAQIAAMLAATVTMGLMAGVFGLYGHTIMRGLGKTDDRTFVGAFQSMDRAIINPLFMSWFFGALVFTGAAALLYFRKDSWSVLPWIVVAFALYFVVVAITMAIHLPLNDGLKEAGDPDRIANLAAARDDFHETRWVVWNVVRTVLSSAAFVCLLWGLVLHGRLTGSAGDSADASGPLLRTAGAGRDLAAAAPAGWSYTEPGAPVDASQYPARVGVAGPSRYAGPHGGPGNGTGGHPTRR